MVTRQIVVNWLIDFFDESGTGLPELSLNKVHKLSLFLLFHSPWIHGLWLSYLTTSIVILSDY